MKKLWKKLVAVTTAVMMAITLLPAMANAATTIENGNQTGTLNITKQEANSKAPVEGAVFTAYKVAELVTGTDGTYQKFQLIDPFTSLNVSKDNLGNISTAELETLANTARQKAEDAEKNNTTLTKIVSRETAADGTTSISNLEKGYYLIVETTTPTGYVAAKPFFVSVPTAEKNANGEAVGWTYTINAVPKNEAIGNPEKTVDKETVGTNGEVTYTIKGTQVAKYDEGYDVDTLKYWISDEFPEGFSLKEDTLKVYNSEEELNKENGTALNEGTDYTLQSKAELDGKTFVVKFEGEQVKKQEGKTIYVRYTAVADNPSAVNTNNADNEFTNNPNGGTEHKTASKDVYSFTISVAKKGDKDDEPLANAEFNLLNENGDILGTGKSNSDGNVTFTKDGKNIKVSEGIYYLEETKAPSGYTLLTSKIKVEVIKITADDGTTSYVYKVNDEESGTTIDKETGEIIVTVENKSGFNLPSTGGMGTYLFTIAGLVIMAGAAFLLIASKRRRA